MDSDQEISASQNQQQQALTRIDSVIRVHKRLASYATRLQISAENATIVLRGTLPNQELSRELLPTIRRAGVLWQVKNRIDIAST